MIDAPFMFVVNGMWVMLRVLRHERGEVDG